MQETGPTQARFLLDSRDAAPSQITRNLRNLARNLALLLSVEISHKGKLRFARFSPSDLRGISGI